MRSPKPALAKLDSSSPGFIDESKRAPDSDDLDISSAAPRQIGFVSGPHPSVFGRSCRHEDDSGSVVRLHGRHQNQVEIKVVDRAQVREKYLTRSRLSS
ncbi:hypothetical protein SAMD00023353_0301820 [Rosellinia necatrix]|uniref:Uncharacterized protein n=1 Tax=Rosellinia necatrix TaxID=77044 RepID=A0A1S8A562_ROSNE|nr:hypothetical protein SAMD00023353_0301820 [Rosellinia necatrix]